MPPDFFIQRPQVDYDNYNDLLPQISNYLLTCISPSTLNYADANIREKNCE